VASKRDDIQKLQGQTVYQVQVIPDKGWPYAHGEVKGYAKRADAEQILTDLVKGYLDGGAKLGLDPRAAEFPDATYLAGTSEGHLRARVIERSAWDCLPPAESDRLQAEVDAEAATAQEVARAAELEAARMEAALFVAKRDASKDPYEQVQLGKLADRAEAKAVAIEREIEERALEAKRAEVLEMAAAPARSAARK